MTFSIRTALASLAAGAAFGLASVASAATVTVVDTASLPSGGSYTLGNFSTDQDPLGQTFTLTETLESLQLGGVVSDVNSQLNPTFDLTILLYQGAGFGGTLLGSVSFTLANGFSGLTVKDFGFVGALVAGTYTVGFSSGGTGRGRLHVTSGAGDANSDPYNENGPFTIFDNATRDFQVLVRGDTIGAPEIPLPGALPLMASALFGGWAMRRRRKAKAA